MRRSFTLIELLVVVAIIAVLVAILLPALQTARDKAKKVMCMSHLSQIIVGCIMYAQDNHEKLMPGYWFAHGYDMYDGNTDPNGHVHPKVPGFIHLGLLLSGSYITDINLMFCPASSTPNAENYDTIEPPRQFTGYCYRRACNQPEYRQLGGKEGEIFTIASCDVVYPFNKIPFRHKDGFPVGYSDGHVRYIQAGPVLVGNMGGNWPPNYSGLFGWMDEFGR